MSNRFHNKWHRANHHTFKSSTTPDAGYDPIASSDSPFLGNFHLSGSLMAFKTNDQYYNVLANSARIDELSAKVITVSDSISAGYLNVDYLNINYYETSGFTLSGGETSTNIPATFAPNDKLVLQSIGLSSNRWANFGGDVKASGTLYVPATANIRTLHTAYLWAKGTDGASHLGQPTIISNSPIHISASATGLTVANNISATNIRTTNTMQADITRTGSLAAAGSAVLLSNNINGNGQNIYNLAGLSATNANFNTVFANTYLGLTSDSLIFNIFNGWETPVLITSLMAPPLGLDNIHISQLGGPGTAAQNQQIAAAVATVDSTIQLRVEAADFQGYCELSASVDGVCVGALKVGNFGLITDADITHAHSETDPLDPKTIVIDNESTMSFIVPSGSSWSIDCGDVYGSNYVNGILYEQKQTQINVADSASVSLTVSALTATNSISLSSTMTFNNVVSAINVAPALTPWYLSVTVQGSSLWLPLYKG